MIVITLFNGFSINSQTIEEINMVKFAANINYSIIIQDICGMKEYWV